MAKKEAETFPSYREYLKAPTMIMMWIIASVMAGGGIATIVFFGGWEGYLLGGILILLLPLLPIISYFEYKGRKKWFDSSRLFTVTWYDEDEKLVAKFKHIRAVSRDEARLIAARTHPYKYWDAEEEKA